MNDDMRLDHERLEVYQLSRELSRVGGRLMRDVPRGAAPEVDEFRRASLSVPLNIAEGGGEFAPKEKARFYRMAKRSATECAAVLDRLVDLDLLAESAVQPAKHLLRRIVGALVSLIHSLERRSN